MGGRARARVVHGSLAAAAAVLATAAATVDIPDKLHLKATPILFYAVPISMPLPPLASLGCGDVNPKPFPMSFPRTLSPKDCATPPLLTPPSLSPPCALGRDSSSAYAASPFSLAQGSQAISVSSRRALSHLFPVYLATSVVPHIAAVSLHPGSTIVTPPALAPFAFATSALYAAPVAAKHVTGAWRQPGYYSASDSSISQAHSSAYLKSLLSSLSSFEPLSTPKLDNLRQPSQSLHTWHVPTRRGHDGDGNPKEPALTVVLLGWLGAQQKHLKKYADWYNARGVHAVTFVIPMADILSFKVEKNAEEHVDALARHLVQWLHDDQGDDERGVSKGEKQLMFHTFSNTGWLTYGVVLEKMQEQGEDLVGRIKGCVIDSAPVPNADPQVWASGFSAALLKKRSSATKPAVSLGEVEEGVTAEAASQGAVANLEVGGANGLETAVLSVLEKFFSIFLKLPAINQRLAEVVMVLQKKQPLCPQLYIYSTADKVIPVKAVEAFIEEQRKTGRVVRACNLQTSPHVDHFRSYPHLYSEQLSSFLKEVFPSTHANPKPL